MGEAATRQERRRRGSATPLSLQDLARLSCMEVRLPPLPPWVLRRLNLEWHNRVNDRRYSFKEALRLAAGCGMSDLFLFLKRVFEHRGGACSEILVAAAEQGDLQAVEFCWNIGLRSKMYEAFESASERGHWKVKNFFVDKARNGCIYCSLCCDHHPASEMDLRHMMVHVFIDTRIMEGEEFFRGQCGKSEERLSKKRRV